MRVLRSGFRAEESVCDHWSLNRASVRRGSIGLFAPGRSDPEFFWVNGLYVRTAMERRRRPSVQVPIEQRPKELFHGPSSS